MIEQTKPKKKTPVLKTEDELIEESTAEDVSPTSVPQSQLTLEMALYAVIFIVGVALRFWNLGNYPLSDTEAQQSLLAFQLVNGGALEATAYSPLLVTLNSLTFLLFQSTDATARLATVLLGSVLILAPATLRRQLDTGVCLLASALLALSPSAIFLSRTLNSQIGVAVGALLIVSGFFNWTAAGQRRWLLITAAGAAMLLTAGPLAYSIIVVFAVIILFKLNDFKTAWQQGLAHTEELSAASPENKQNDEQSATIHPDLQQAGIFLLIAFALLSTAATFNLSGVGVASGLFSDWLSRIGLQAQPNAGFNAVFLLIIYEPFLVFAGLVGLAYALLSGNLLRLTLSGWLIGVLVIDLVMGGRPNGSIILAVVPLAFLAALALTDLWQGLERWGSWANEGIILASGVVIIIFGYIGLTGWLARACDPTDTFCRLAWLQTVAAISLFMVIVAFFWFINGSGVALRGAALTGVLLGIMATVSIGWRLNYGPLMNLGYQPLAGVPASDELVTLADTLSSESVVRVGDKSLLDITLVRLEQPSLLWQLRDYAHLNRAGSLVSQPTNAIITPTPGDGDNNFGLGSDYAGQDFALNSIWSPVGIQPKELINWLIYRKVDQRPESQKIVLWLRLN